MQPNPELVPFVISLPSPLWLMNQKTSLTTPEVLPRENFPINETSLGNLSRSHIKRLSPAALVLTSCRSYGDKDKFDIPSGALNIDKTLSFDKSMILISWLSLTVKGFAVSLMVLIVECSILLREPVMDFNVISLSSFLFMYWLSLLVEYFDNANNRSSAVLDKLSSTLFNNGFEAGSLTGVKRASLSLSIFIW